MRRLYIVLAALLASLTCNGTIEIEFKEGLKGDLHTQEKIAENTPVVILYHGGGWNSMSKKNVTGIADFLNGNGCVVFNVNYRLAGKVNPWPACGNDCIDAANFVLKGGLKSYGVHPKKIWLCGASAGGHLALWTGLSLPSSKVEGIISISGIGDPYPDLAAHSSRYTTLFGGRKPSDKDMEAMNPCKLIRPNGPKVLLTHVKEDSVVPAECSGNFYIKYTKAGNYASYSQYSINDEASTGGHCIWKTGTPKQQPNRLIDRVANEISHFMDLGTGMDVYSFAGKDFARMFSYKGWQTSFLNGGPTFTHVTYLEKHDDSDEIFVLLSGSAKMYLGEGKNPVTLKKGKIYNVRQGTWHQVEVSENAKVLVVENSGRISGSKQPFASPMELKTAQAVNPLAKYATNGIPYHIEEIKDTPAPRGYSPFYISHYGRHGSRYYANEETIAPLMQVLKDGEKEGKLSQTGRELLDSMNSVIRHVSGHTGHITKRGESEHRMISTRMYNRFQPVFDNGGKVRCMASTYLRCIESMAVFSSKLNSLESELECSFLVGDAYQPKVIREDYPRSIVAFHKEDSDKLYDSYIDRKDVVSRLFIEAPQISYDSAASICRSLYHAWLTCLSDDLGCIDILNYMSEDELKGYAFGYNDWYYVNHCNADDQTGAVRLSYAKECLTDILDGLSKAADGTGDVVADLKFGHDIGLSSLASLMGIEGFAIPRKVGKIHKTWDCAQNMPMAANLQIILYKNGSGKVIVKLLYDEDEITIPALEPLRGPYYKWVDVQEYWQGRLTQLQ